ncbi:MAG TPA: N-6 DNA methylase [Candidatus Acidoferrales bacterium]|nr:N-6 DNA methylase [Candidatus Acidoferrales bacterium]
MNHIGRLNVRTKRRIRKNNVEAALEDAVYIQESVMVMDAAVSVAVHYHIHLARARHAVIGVSAEDTAVRKLPEASTALLLVERFLYTEALARVRAAVDKPIASLFDLPKGKDSKTKTEILFIERCLALLKPGGKLGIVLPEGIFNNPSLAYVREFCENRAFIRAVVSLPQETFISSGASVKASLLFMQKFSEKEQADFDTKQHKANREVRAKYADAIAGETLKLETAIADAMKAQDTEKRKGLQRELAEYQKRMADTIASETRALLKERFPYPVFLYEAERVGITATGDTDQNELFPNVNQPPGDGKTCLELYHEFRRNPKAFFIREAGR